MSELLPISLPVTQEPFRVSVRRLRWLHEAMDRQIQAISAQTGVGYGLDSRRLAAAFVSWLRRIEAQRPHDPSLRREYFDFAASLMLYELVLKRPVTVIALPDKYDRENPEHFWPEGFAYTVFCMNVRAAVVAQEFDISSDMSSKFFNIRNWWSFRENAIEDPNTVIGFFELFIGLEPDWLMPTAFRDKILGKYLPDAVK